MGFGLPSPMLPLPNPRTCYWGGWGGSLAIIDMDAKLSFSYVMNKMERRPPATRAAPAPSSPPTGLMS